MKLSLLFRRLQGRGGCHGGRLYQGETSRAMRYHPRRFGQVGCCLFCGEHVLTIKSLINERNRSFFLNQLDGLEGNDGLLIIGTTNHFERLDPGLSTRPSRFDRK